MTKPSVGELLIKISGQLADLVRAEIKISLDQAKAKAASSGAAIAVFVVAGIFGFLMLATLIAAAVLWVASYMHPALAALVVAGGLLLIILILGLIGRTLLRKHQMPSAGDVKTRLVEDFENIKAGMGDE